VDIDMILLFDIEVFLSIIVSSDYGLYNRYRIIIT
jgi:hypothetical protein